MRKLSKIGVLSWLGSLSFLVSTGQSSLLHDQLDQMLNNLTKKTEELSKTTKINYQKTTNKILERNFPKIQNIQRSNVQNNSPLLKHPAKLPNNNKKSSRHNLASVLMKNKKMVKIVGNKNPLENILGQKSPKIQNIQEKNVQNNSLSLKLTHNNNEPSQDSLASTFKEENISKEAAISIILQKLLTHLPIESIDTYIKNPKFLQLLTTQLKSHIKEIKNIFPYLNIEDEGSFQNFWNKWKNLIISKSKNTSLPILYFPIKEQEPIYYPENLNLSIHQSLHTPLKKIASSSLEGYDILTSFHDTYSNNLPLSISSPPQKAAKEEGTFFKIEERIFFPTSRQVEQPKWLFDKNPYRYTKIIGNLQLPEKFSSLQQNSKERPISTPQNMQDQNLSTGSKESHYSSEKPETQNSNNNRFFNSRNEEKGRDEIIMSVQKETYQLLENPERSKTPLEDNKLIREIKNLTQKQNKEDLSISKQNNNRKPFSIPEKDNNRKTEQGQKKKKTPLNNESEDLNIRGQIETIDQPLKKVDYASIELNNFQKNFFAQPVSYTQATFHK